MCLIAGVLAVSMSGRTLWANTELNGTGVANTNGACRWDRGHGGGDDANASGDSAVALGIGSQAAGEEAVTIGGQAASDRYGVAIGGQARALGSVGVAIGKSSYSNGSWCVAIGYNATAKGESAVAIGDHAGYETDGNSNTALGDSSGRFVTGDNNIASGHDAGSGVTGDDNIASGSGAGALVKGSRNVAMGKNAGQGDSPFTPLAVNGTVAIGTGARAGADSAVAIGLGAEAAGERSIAIGTGNVVTGARSGAIGDPNTITGNDSYALGNNNTIQADEAFVVGSGVTVPAGLHGSVVLGNASAAAAPEPAPSAVIGESSTTSPESASVAVGAPGGRQIAMAAGRLSPSARMPSTALVRHDLPDNLAMGSRGHCGGRSVERGAEAALHAVRPVAPGSSYGCRKLSRRGVRWGSLSERNFLLHARWLLWGDHVMTVWGHMKIVKWRKIPEQYRKGPISIYVMRENAQLQSQTQMLTAENTKIKRSLPKS